MAAALVPAIETTQAVGDAVCQLARAIGKLNGMGDGDVQAKLEELKAGQVDIMKGQEAIKVMMSNIPRRNYNAMSQFHDHELEVLRAEEGPNVGQEPPAGMYPKTRGDISPLTNAQLNALEVFYKRDFKGTSVAARQAKLMAFLGVQ